jgi:hypothetical protein
MPNSTSLTFIPLHLIARIAAAIAGAYAFTWCFSAMCIAVLVALGLSFHDAEKATPILAFLVYPAMFMWCFACRRLWRVWGVLAGGSACMLMAAWVLQNNLLV